MENGLFEMYYKSPFACALKPYKASIMSLNRPNSYQLLITYKTDQLMPTEQIFLANR